MGLASGGVKRLTQAAISAGLSEMITTLGLRHGPDSFTGEAAVGNIALSAQA